MQARVEENLDSEVTRRDRAATYPSYVKTSSWKYTVCRNKKASSHGGGEMGTLERSSTVWSACQDRVLKLKYTSWDCEHMESKNQKGMNDSPKEKLHGKGAYIENWTSTSRAEHLQQRAEHLHGEPNSQEEQQLDIRYKRKKAFTKRTESVSRNEGRQPVGPCVKGGISKGRKRLTVPNAAEMPRRMRERDCALEGEIRYLWLC